MTSLMPPLKPSSSNGRAALRHIGSRRRTLGQGAVVIVNPSPPVDGVDVVVVESEESEHRHKGRPGIETSGQHVYVPSPPDLVLVVHEVVEEDADDEPGGVVHRVGRRHHGRRPEQHREVDERDPLLLGEDPRQHPDRERQQQPHQEVVVEGGVDALGAEHAQRADDSPDDGRAVEDGVVGARPRAALR
ncbi:hypothetical protein BHE74_00024488 [Ensete ventricosum]|nr:hypothetical protein BHE74_00024488 [Ensete ventricosum]